MMRLASAVAVLCAVACTKADPPGSTSTTASSAAPATSAPVAVQASAAPTAQPTAAAAPVAAGAFAGKYDAKASTLYLPDTPEMKRVKWRGDEEATTGLGAGDLALTIDADGRVHGETKGALGALVVEGRTEGDRVAATLRPKGTESGFTGTLEGTKKGNVVSGQMSLTDDDASVLRVATFELASK